MNRNNVNVCKWKVLSGSWLKLIAVISMTIDHTAAFLMRYDEQYRVALVTLGHKEISYYFIMRSIGRLAFPIFAFLVVEGAIHTRNRKKYGCNLLLFAFISELPWNLVHAGTWYYSGQNVFFTLLLGYLGICTIKRFHSYKSKMLKRLIALLLVSILLKADYGCSGYGFILLLYVLRSNVALRAIIGSCFLNSQWMAGLAFIPIHLYNGKRGFIKGHIAKYVFYSFYPTHLLLLYYIRLKYYC